MSSVDRDFHLLNNRQTERLWSDYEGHRQSVMEVLLGRLDSRSQSMALVGAGNCNDVDLKACLSRVPLLTLIDLDRDSMQRGVARQKADIVELIAQRLETFAEAVPTRRFDTLISCCVLSQIAITAESEGLSPHQAMSQHLEALLALADRQVLILSDFGQLPIDEVPSHAPAPPHNSSLPANIILYKHLAPHQITRLLLDAGPASRQFRISEILKFWSWHQGDKNLAVFAVEASRIRLWREKN